MADEAPEPARDEYTAQYMEGGRARIDAAAAAAVTDDAGEEPATTGAARQRR